MIDHQRHYVDGPSHTNTIENAFSVSVRFLPFGLRSDSRSLRP
jgi:hypothetical protein